MSNTLGNAIAVTRSTRGLSLNGAAREAKISPAYLMRIENNQVNQPSPNILLKISDALKIPYPSLMEMAGYVPTDPDAPRVNHALSNQELTPDEENALAAYLALYRKNNKQSAQ